MPLPVPMPVQASDNAKVTFQMCYSLAPEVYVTLFVSKGKTCFKFMLNIKAKLIFFGMNNFHYHFILSLLTSLDSLRTDHM